MKFFFIALAAAVFAWLAYASSVFAIDLMHAQKPNSVRIPLDLPKDAEVRPAGTVHPGTFKIELSVSELLEKAAKNEHVERPLVAYDQFGNLQYWLSRRDGTFYHAYKWQEDPFRARWGGWCTYPNSTRVERGELVLEPGKEDIPILMFVAALIFLVVAAMCAVSSFDNRPWA